MYVLLCIIVTSIYVVWMYSCSKKKLPRSLSHARLPLPRITISKMYILATLHITHLIVRRNYLIIYIVRTVQP